MTYLSIVLFIFIFMAFLLTLVISLVMGKSIHKNVIIVFVGLLVILLGVFLASTFL